MKRTRLMIAVILLSALLFFGCSQAAEQAGEEAAPVPEEEAQSTDLYPFVDFPPEASPQQTKTASGQVTPTKVENSLFQAKFEGSDVSGSGGPVGGKYHFLATQTDGESWHVKLEANYPTVAGRDYSVTYKFTSDVAGTIKFGDFQEFQIQEGENTVTGNFTAKDSTSYLDLQLGMLPAFTIDFTEIEVKEYEDDVDYENALPSPINFERESRVYEKHDAGYDTIVVRRNHAINVNYESIPTDLGVWKSKLYVRTGFTPEQGVHYRVTADVMSDRYDRNIPFELLLNDGDVEKGYGALYGQELVPNEVKTCEAVITGNGNGDELILQFSLGEARGGSVIVVGNVHVDKIIDHYTNVLPEGFALDESIATGKMLEEQVPVSYTNIPLSPTFYSGVDTVYEQHDDGYVVNLTEGESSATMAIVQAPANPDDRGVWKAKLYAATGVNLNPNTHYRIQFDLDSTGDQANYEVCFDGDSENAYGALYGRSLKAGGTDHIDQLVTPEVGGGPLTIRIQLGKTDTASGNTVTLRNLSVDSVLIDYSNVLPDDFSYKTAEEERDVEYESVLPDDFSYTAGVNVWEMHDDGYGQEVSASDDTAELAITTAPESERGVWKSRLYINTGVTPEAGTRYVVSFDVTGEKDQAKYEILFDGDSENSYGGLYDRSLSAGAKQGINYSLVPEKSDGPLVIRFQLGETDDASGNVITVSNLKVRAVTATATSLGDIDYTSSFNVREEHSDGIEQSASASGSTATLNVTQGRTEGGVWSSRFFINTGVTPEAGKRYRVTATVSSEKEIGDFELMLDNGRAENGYNAKQAKLSVEAGGSKTIVADFTAPSSACDDVVLRFQLGNSPADNTITVSDIQVCELVDGEMEEQSLPEPFYPVTGEDVFNEGSFLLGAEKGATAELSGDGSSATATVTNSTGEDWHVKFYALTGLELEAGQTYRISFDVEGADGCEVCYKRSGGEEKDFGVESVSGDSATVTHTVTPDQSGNLEVMLKLGTLPTGAKVTMSNVTVEKEGQVFEDVVHHYGAWVSTDAESGAEATFDDPTKTATVTNSTNIDWHIKFYYKPFAEEGWDFENSLTLEAGNTYQVTMTVEGAPGCQVCFKNASSGDPDAAETGFGDIWLSDTADPQTITKEITPGSDGVLEILVKIGALPNDSVVTISDVQITKAVPSDFSPVPLSGFTYPSIEKGKTSEKHQFLLEAGWGATAELSGDGSSATATVTNSTGEDWHVKFYALTGLELEAGQTYRISFDVEGADGCEVCYKRSGGEEKDFGVESVSGDSATVTHTVTPDQSGNLEVMLKLGTLPTGAKVTMSNVTVEKKAPDTAGENLMTDTLRTWAPVHFWANDGYEAVLTDNGASAKLTLINVPDAGKESWMTKLFVETGFTLKGGKTYRISADVQSTEELPYEICYNDAMAADDKVEAALGSKGDLTATGTNETVTYEVKPEGDASLVLQFNLGNAKAGTAVTVSNVKVEELSEEFGDNLMTDPLVAWAPVHSFVDAGYTASLTNDDSSATMEFTSVAEETMDWKAKLYVETGAQLEAGKKYRISYDLEADSDFTYHAFYGTAADEKVVGEFYNLTTGEMQEHVVAPESDAELIIQLLIGYTNAPNKVKISNVQVDEIIGDVGPMGVPINFWAHEDYVASLSNTDSSASIAITQVPETGREAWKVKLFAETGAKLEAGKTYRINVDLQASDSLTYDICYNNREHEAQVGAQYGLQASTGKKTVSYTVTPSQDAVLTLQLNLGNASGANTVTISNVKVDEVNYRSATSVIPGFRYDSVGYLSKGSDEGYVTSLVKHDSSADFLITQAPAERHAWNAKVIVKTGITPKSGKGYRVSFDVDAAKPQNLFELFCDGAKELDYGALYEQHLSAGRNSFSYTIMPGDSKGELTLQLRFGETNGTDGNSYTISNFKFEEVEFVTQQKPEIKNVCVNDTQDGYAAQLTTTPKKATLRLVQTPKEGLEAWKNKLFVYTGTILEPGQKYRISMNVKSIIPAPFEVCFNNLDVEKGLGGIFGLTSIPTGYLVEYYPNVKENTPLVLQLSLGNCTTPNTIFLSDVKVEKAGAVNLISDTIYSF